MALFYRHAAILHLFATAAEARGSRLGMQGAA